MDAGGKGNGHDTVYLGTGEANRCTSGCEAGVGVDDLGERFAVCVRIVEQDEEARDEFEGRGEEIGAASVVFEMDRTEFLRRLHERMY